MLARCGMGMGALALTNLLGRSGMLQAASLGESGSPAGTTQLGATLNPLLPKFPQFPGKAKRVIHLFMNGGPSQVDTFDPKPSLAKWAGKSLPMPTLRTERKTGASFPSPYKFKKYGQ